MQSKIQIDQALPQRRGLTEPASPTINWIARVAREFQASS